MSDISDGEDARSPTSRNDILEGIGKAAKELTADVNEAAAEAAKTAIVAASELSEAINKGSGALAAKAKTEIRARPLAAAGLAVFAGALFGVVLSRIGRNRADRI